MNKPANPPLDAAPNWRSLVDATVLVAEPGDLSRRIQEAQDAVMDYIEDSFEVASQSERQSMINAMNSLRELQRLVATAGSQVQANPRNFTDA
jgi:hypothetical protein